MPSPCSVFSMPGPMPLIFFRSSGSPSGEGSAGGGVPRTGSAAGAAAPVAAPSELACRLLAALASLSSCSSRAMRSRPFSSACSSPRARLSRLSASSRSLGQRRLEPTLRLARRSELRAQTIGFVREACCHAAVALGRRGSPSRSRTRAPRPPARRSRFARTEPRSFSPHAQAAGSPAQAPPLEPTARAWRRFSATLSVCPAGRPSVPETRPDQPLRGACLCHFLVARSSATGVH